VRKLKMLYPNEEINLSSKDAQGKRIRYIRDQMLGLSRREFAEHHSDLKITEAVLQNWEEGRYKGLKDKQVNLILKALEREGILCEKLWLLNGIGNPPQKATHLDFQQNMELSETDAVAKELRIFHSLYTDSIDIIINDSAMEPFLKIGDHVAGVRYMGNDIEKTVGKFCIVQTKVGQILTRRIEHGDESGLYTLIGFNEKINPQKNIQLFSSAPILWWRRLLVND
jgi:DNA-binding transcriptional regulator YiaG